jgi:PKD repeat protein
MVLGLGLRRCRIMTRSQILGRIGGVALLAGALLLAGCALYGPQVDADFTVSETEGATPLLVEFTPLVAGDPAHFYWDFGDGETSTDASPVHVYRTEGIYDVLLMVTLADGSQGQARKEGVIEVQTAARKEGRLSSLYWLNTGSGTIHRGDRAGYQQETIVQYIYQGADLAVGGGYVFWAEDDSIYRANYDGTGKKTLIVNQSGLLSVTVDNELGQIYWSCLPSPPYINTYWKGFVKRANLDGTGVTVLKTFDSYSMPFVQWIRSDANGEKVYWFLDDYNVVVPMAQSPTASGDEKIQYGEVPSLSPHLVKAPIGGMITMALDVSDGPATYVYWTTSSAIKRCRVNGSDLTTIRGSLDSPKGIAVDLVEGKMYWSDGAGIHRANVDGTEAELIYPGVRADILVIQEF